jgi:hypothetical protein
MYKIFVVVAILLISTTVFAGSLGLDLGLGLGPSRHAYLSDWTWRSTASITWNSTDAMTVR